MVKVSVIVPVYNKEKELNININTLLNQTLSDIEVILVNDGSNDNSGKICDEIKLNDSRVKVIHQENRGVSAARNAGISIASGDYIGFMDPDDWIEADMYQNMYSKIVKMKAEVCLCNYSFDNEKGSRPILLDTSLKVLNKEQIFQELVLNMIASENLYEHENSVIGAVWRQLISREVIETNKILFVEGLPIMEDLVFSIELLTKIDKACIDTNVNYHYVQDTGSAINKYRPDLYSLYHQVNVEIGKRLKREKKSRIVRNRIMNRYVNLALKIVENETKNNAKLSVKLTNIRNMSKNETVTEAVRNIDIDKLKFQKKVAIYSLKYNRPLIVYVYYAMRRNSALFSIYNYTKKIFRS